jgi:hypothetical protein
MLPARLDVDVRGPADRNSQPIGNATIPSRANDIRP